MEIQFRKGYKSQFTHQIFRSVKIATYKPPAYNIFGEKGDKNLRNLRTSAFKVYHLKMRFFQC